MYKDFNKKNLFYCYSINLYHFLKINKFRYLDKGHNKKTNKNYWIFERTPEFIVALTYFSNSKEK